MNASLRHIGIGCLSLITPLALLTIGCGEKGTDTPSDDGMSSAATSAGGSPSAGGGSTTGGGTAVPENSLTFEGSDEGWAPLYTAFADSVDPADQFLETDIVVEVSADEGNPDGALKVTVPYTAYGQYAGIGAAVSQLDLTGITIRADVQLQSGMLGAEDLVNNPAGAKLYVKAGEAYAYAAGTYNKITSSGVWHTITFNLALPDYKDESNGTYDPADIREIGIQFDTATIDDTATLEMSTPPEAAVFLIDNVEY